MNCSLKTRWLSPYLLLFIESSQQNMKCQNHPLNTAVKFCMDCHVPFCVECVMISEDHGSHSVIEIQSKKVPGEEEKTGSNFPDDPLKLKSIAYQQEHGHEQMAVPYLLSIYNKIGKGTIPIAGCSEEKFKIAKSIVPFEEEKTGSDFPDDEEQMADIFSLRYNRGKGTTPVFSLLYEKDKGTRMITEKSGEKLNIASIRHTSLQENPYFDKKLGEVRKNSLNIEQTHSQQYHRNQVKTTDYEDIIQRIDYLDCSGLEFSKVEKKLKGIETFSQIHADDFFSWMMQWDEVFQKTQSPKCRSILSTLFAAYTKEAIIEFKPKTISFIIDRCMDHVIENKNHILVLELVRTFMFDVNFNLQKHFKGRKINSVLIDTILQAAKCMILSKCPKLQQNTISLSFCYECSQESRLVMIMSYKGSIEMKDGIPEKAMGLNLVLYNYTQPSDEAYTVFTSIVASCSKINLPFIAKKEAKQLFKKHSNLTLISASPFKSTGFSKGRHRVVEKPCITLLCLHKGYIPFGEREFPKEINGFEVDVQEGYCSLGSGRSIDFGGHIRRARGINTPGNGSIGGFVDLSDGSVGLLTCAHVVFSSDELLTPNSEMYNFVLGRGIDLNVDFFDKNQHNFQLCGTIVDKRFPSSSDNNSVDAALIKLDPTVNEYVFPATDQLYSAGKLFEYFMFYSVINDSAGD